MSDEKMLIAFGGYEPNGWRLGDNLFAIEMAARFTRWEGIRAGNLIVILTKDDVYLPLWERFLEAWEAIVVWLDPGDANERMAYFDEIRSEMRYPLPDGGEDRFDHYREIFRWVDREHRPLKLGGYHESGGTVYKMLSAGNGKVSQYNHGEEDDTFSGPVGNFGIMDIESHRMPSHDVLIAPFAIGQGMDMYTMDFWRIVATSLADRGYSVTVHYPDNVFPHKGIRNWFSSVEDLPKTIRDHRCVLTGNSGLAWLSEALDVPWFGHEDRGTCKEPYWFDRYYLRFLKKSYHSADPAQTVHDVTEFLKMEGREPTGRIDESEWEGWITYHTPPNGRVALDVGANEGQWTWRLAETFGKVIAFEPGKRTYAKLVSDMGSRTNVELINKAAWNCTGFLPFTDHHDASHSGVQGYDVYSGEPIHSNYEVVSDRIDAMVASDDQVDFIKVDVEGVEIFVIYGMARTIERCHPELMIECHEKETREFLISWLDRVGYCFSILRNPNVWRGDNMTWLHAWPSDKPPAWTTRLVAD